MPENPKSSQPENPFADQHAQEIAQQYDRFQDSFAGIEKERQYLNYGYTTSSGQSYEDRQEALCMLVFEKAAVEPEHRLIDVGFGSGEQNFLWARSADFRQLVGYNISRKQVDHANARAAEEEIEQQLRFVHGRAEELPGAEAESADRLLAVECAFYFDRATFYQRAAEVLRPGGLLVAADISFAAVATPLIQLRSDMRRVGTLRDNRRLWEPHFSTREITPIHREVVPGVELSVREIARVSEQGGFSAEQLKQWQSMAFWSRLVALGLRTRLLRYDLIVLERS